MASTAYICVSVQVTVRLLLCLPIFYFLKFFLLTFNNAHSADQKYNNTPPGVEGPIYKRLMQLNENAGGCTKSTKMVF